MINLAVIELKDIMKYLIKITILIVIVISLTKFFSNFKTKINIEKDEYGVKLKFPNRTCKQCIRYPCFANIDKCASNFAAYGCIYYESKNNK